MAVTLLFNQEMMNLFSLYMLIPMINFPKSFKASSTFLLPSFIIMDQECFITASMGMSAVDISLATIEQALHQADQALIAAKRTGKNKLVTYNSSHVQRFSNQIQMETELRKAILENQLFLYYQPRLELSTGNIICLEALVRWNHPNMA